MKVHELIELLKTCPQEADVEINIKGDEFDQDEVNRAATMREKVLRIIEAKNARIRELEKKLEQAYLVIGEVVDKPNPFTKE